MKPETERLMELMRLSGWNQAQTAQELGLNQSNVSRLLAEKTAMHGSTKKLMEILLQRQNKSPNTTPYEALQIIEEEKAGNEVKIMELFLKQLGEQAAAEFVVNLRRSVAGLSQNNRAYQREFSRLYAEQVVAGDVARRDDLS